MTDPADQNNDASNSNIVSLHGDKVEAPREPIPEIIERLEEFLEGRDPVRCVD